MVVAIRESEFFTAGAALGHPIDGARVCVRLTPKSPYRSSKSKCRVAGWDPNEKVGGGGTVEAFQPEMARGGASAEQVPNIVRVSSPSSIPGMRGHLSLK